MKKLRSNKLHLCDLVELGKENDKKILGFAWDDTNDTLSYQAIMPDTNIITKRSTLAAVAKIFDPLGLLSPITIKAKILLQELWKMKLEWVSAVPYHIQQEWISYTQKLPEINDLRISRRITQDENISIFIYGFSDSSGVAYGACLYINSINWHGTTQSHLICAKTSVAPLKMTSLPRLELRAAQLLAHLYAKIVPKLNIRVTRSYFWTDSQIVLAWLRSESRTWKTFIANRVSNIQSLTSVND